MFVEAARIVTGGTKLCSIDKLYSELGWDSLQSRRNNNLITMYKILHGLTPNYPIDLMPPTVQETSRSRVERETDVSQMVVFPQT